MTDRLSSYSMANACSRCKRPIVRTETPDGEKVTDVEPRWGMVICGPVGSVEPRWVQCYLEHECQGVKR